MLLPGLTPGLLRTSQASDMFNYWFDVTCMAPYLLETPECYSKATKTDTGGLGLRCQCRCFFGRLDRYYAAEAVKRVLDEVGVPESDLTATGRFWLNKSG